MSSFLEYDLCIVVRQHIIGMSEIVVASLCKDASQITSFVTDAVKLDLLRGSQFISVSSH